MNWMGPAANDTLSVVVVLLMPGEPPGLMLATQNGAARSYNRRKLVLR
jgi:hypothetical protein